MSRSCDALRQWSLRKDPGCRAVGGILSWSSSQPWEQKTFETRLTTAPLHSDTPACSQWTVTARFQHKVPQSPNEGRATSSLRVQIYPLKSSRCCWIQITVSQSLTYTTICLDNYRSLKITHETIPPSASLKLKQFQPCQYPEKYCNSF